MAGEEPGSASGAERGESGCACGVHDTIGVPGRTVGRKPLAIDVDFLACAGYVGPQRMRNFHNSFLFSRGFMTKRLAFAAVAVLGLVLAGCKDSHEKVISDSVSKMKEVVAVMKTVTDEASAKSAAPKIQALGDDMKKIKDRMDKLGKPSDSEDKRLQAKYEKELREVTSDLMKESMRISFNVKGSTAVQDALKNLK